MTALRGSVGEIFGRAKDEVSAVKEKVVRKTRPHGLALPLGDELTNLELSVAEGSRPIVVTMTQLNREAGETMTTIISEHVAALVTKHGRFVAAIVPLEPGTVEQQVFGQMSEKIASSTSDLSRTRSLEYVAKDLDVDLRSRRGSS